SFGFQFGLLILSLRAFGCRPHFADGRRKHSARHQTPAVRRDCLLLHPGPLGSPVRSPMQFLSPQVSGEGPQKTTWRNKTMRIEQAKQITEQALDELIQAVEAGKSDTLKAYLATMSRFHRYSWGNLLLTMFQMPAPARVAGFQTWKSLGRFVKKGEKGIMIL